MGVGIDYFWTTLSIFKPHQRALRPPRTPRKGVLLQAARLGEFQTQVREGSCPLPAGSTRRSLTPPSLMISLVPSPRTSSRPGAEAQATHTTRYPKGHGVQRHAPPASPGALGSPVATVSQKRREVVRPPLAAESHLYKRSVLGV